ncbi:transcription factor, component of CCR4 transcriptional complex, partial [Phyllosticta capitalensis]
MRLRPAGVRSPTISLARARCRVFTLSAARPLAPRLRSTAAFVASPHSSIRSFATTTDAPTSKPSSSKTPEYYGTVIKNPPTAPAPSGIAPLPHRTVILVAGDMTTAFLNGLTTNKIPSWNKQEEDGVRGIYTGILNPQGRVLFDAFVYPTAVKSKDGEYVRGCYLEVDEMVRKQFMILLKRYKLRTKLTLEYARDMGVFAAWGPGFNDPERPGRHLPKVGGSVVMRDERIPGFGTRFVAPEMEDVAALPRVSTAHYHIRRFLKGLPEGSQEMQLGEALPLECNMDLMKGIDFQKGCYVGQELTIRTKHTGVVRKRILPIRLYNLDAGSVPTTLELELTKEEQRDLARQVREHRRKNRAVGRFLNGTGNVGLALCRLDAMTDVNVPG